MFQDSLTTKFKQYFICSHANLIGKVTYFFWQREYQSRGVQHIHFLIWVDKAPILGESTNEEKAEFILKYVTCRIPNKKVSPILHRRVMTHQTHHHNAYCLRNRKTKKGSLDVVDLGMGD